MTAEPPKDYPEIDPPSDCDGHMAGVAILMSIATVVGFLLGWWLM